MNASKAALKVFVPEVYISGKNVVIQIVENLGYGIVVPRDELPGMITQGLIKPSIITDRNLIVIEE